MKSWRRKLLTSGRRKDRVQAERARLIDLSNNCSPEQWLSGEHPGVNVEDDWAEFYMEELIPTLEEEREGESSFFQNQGI